MICAADSSVIVAALDPSNAGHASCRSLLMREVCSAHVHSLAETFSTLTGGHLGFRLPAAEVSRILRRDIMPRLQVIRMDIDEMLAALDEAHSRGVRGGAIYDYLHLVAARMAGAARLYTHNTSDFLAFHRPGDPEIAHP